MPEYTVLSPIKVGREYAEEDRPAAIAGRSRPKYYGEIVREGTIELSEEEATPLLEAKVILPADADLPLQSHDPELVGYEGEAARDKFLEEGLAEEPEPRATEQAKERARALGVDLADVRGTGSDGQITKADVDRASQGG